MQRRLPKVFGLGQAQIKEWETSSRTNWSDEHGTAGKLLFTQAVCTNFRNEGRTAAINSGLGKYVIEDNNLFFTFTSAEFEAWYESNIRTNHENDMRKFLTSKGLSGGLKQVADDSIGGLIKVLFNIDTETPLPQVSATKPNLTKETFKAVLAQQDPAGTATISLGEVSAEQKNILVAEGAEVKRSKLDSLIPHFAESIKIPFDTDTIRFKTSGGLDSNFALSRFEFDRTTLDNLLENPESKALLQKTADCIVSSRISGDNSSPFESLITTRKPGDRRNFFFSELEIVQLLELEQQILKDLNFTNDFNSQFRTTLSELAALPGKKREKFAHLIASQTNTTSGNTNRLQILDRTLEHIAYSLIIKSIYDKRRGLTAKDTYTFDLLSSTVGQISQGQINNAIKVAKKIELDWRKADNLKNAYNSRPARSLRSEASSNDGPGIEEMIFADALRKIADEKDGTELGIQLNIKTTTVDRFRHELDRASRRLNLHGVAGDPIGESIVAWHIKEKGRASADNKEGFLDDFPVGYLNPESADFASRLGSMWAYALVA